MNCNAIRDSGRRAIIDSKSNAVIKGFNARVEMLRFREEHSGTFRRILLLRNNVESVFTSMKARFGGYRACPQGEGPAGGAAIDDRLLQHGLCLRPRHGGGNHPRLPRRLRTTARGPPSRTAPAGNKSVIRRLPRAFLPVRVASAGIKLGRQF